MATLELDLDEGYLRVSIKNPAPGGAPLVIALDLFEAQNQYNVMFDRHAGNDFVALGDELVAWFMSKGFPEGLSHGAAMKLMDAVHKEVDAIKKNTPRLFTETANSPGSTDSTASDSHPSES